jgi:hypothetical protein
VYKMAAKRMSGDYNTGLGNSILNLGLLSAAFEICGVHQPLFMIDGDDSVVVIRRSDFKRCKVLESLFLDCGFVTKIDYANIIEHAEFCQSRIVQTDYGPVFVRNPRKVLSTGGLCPRKLENKQMRQWSAAKALCEVLLNPGVPVIRSVFLRVLFESGLSLEQADAYQFVTMNEQWRKSICDHRLFGCDSVSAASRASFALAWDMDLYEQESIECETLVWPMPKEIRLVRNRNKVVPDWWQDVEPVQQVMLDYEFHEQFENSFLYEHCWSKRAHVFVPESAG